MTELNSFIVESCIESFQKWEENIEGPSQRLLHLLSRLLVSRRHDNLSDFISNLEAFDSNTNIQSYLKDFSDCLAGGSFLEDLQIIMPFLHNVLLSNSNRQCTYATKDLRKDLGLQWKREMRESRLQFLDRQDQSVGRHPVISISPRRG